MSAHETEPLLHDDPLLELFDAFLVIYCNLIVGLSPLPKETVGSYHALFVVVVSSSELHDSLGVSPGEEHRLHLIEGLKLCKKIFHVTLIELYFPLTEEK